MLERIFLSRKKWMIRLITLCLLTSQSVIVNGEEIDEFDRFSKLLTANSRRSYVKPDGGVANARIDSEKSKEAIRQSILWIRWVLKPEFIPDDLESQIELVAAGMEGRNYEGNSGVGPRFDCTIAEFEKGGYHFLITQEAFKISFFVSQLGIDPADRNTSRDGLVTFLQETSKELFHHASASLYGAAIKLTDYGVDTTISWDAQYPDDRIRAWKPLVVVPPKACDDGVLKRSGEPDREAYAQRLKKIDPTLPEDQLDKFDCFWWGGVYAATDGKTLLYRASKRRCGQAGNILKPDWFRIPEPGEIPPKAGSKINPAMQEEP